MEDETYIRNLIAEIAQQEKRDKEQKQVIEDEDMIITSYTYAR